MKAARRLRQSQSQANSLFMVISLTGDSGVFPAPWMRCVGKLVKLLTHGQRGHQFWISPLRNGAPRFVSLLRGRASRRYSFWPQSSSVLNY